MSTRGPAHDREGHPRKRYARPRNVRRERVMAERAARARTWLPGTLTRRERLELARMLDRGAMRLAWQAHDVRAGGELRALREEVLGE